MELSHLRHQFMHLLQGHWNHIVVYLYTYNPSPTDGGVVLFDMAKYETRANQPMKTIQYSQASVP